MRRAHWWSGAVRDSSTPSAAPVRGNIARRRAFMAEAGASPRGQKQRGLFDQPYLLLSLTSLFWAGNTILGRYVVGHVPPITLACVRWGGALLIVLPFAAPHLARDWPTIRKRAGTMVVLAFSGFAGYNALAYYGLQYTTAIHALLLLSAAPLFVALWSFMLFGDRLTPRQAGGIGISLAGVLVIISHGSLALLIGVGFNQGDAWILIALVIYAYYVAVLRNRPPMHPLSFLAVAMGTGALILSPAMAWELGSGKTLVLDAVSVACFIFVSVFPSLLGYLFLNRGVALIGANRAAPFIHLVPVFGSVMAVAFLGERFELYHGIGYALVFGGITVAARK
jgi:drug/metabolite transporter (DMT)-like permease